MIRIIMIMILKMRMIIIIMMTLITTVEFFCFFHFLYDMWRHCHCENLVEVQLHLHLQFQIQELMKLINISITIVSIDCSIRVKNFLFSILQIFNGNVLIILAFMHFDSKFALMCTAFLFSSFPGWRKCFMINLFNHEVSYLVLSYPLYFGYPFQHISLSMVYFIPYVMNVQRSYCFLILS